MFSSRWLIKSSLVRISWMSVPVMPVDVLGLDPNSGRSKKAGLKASPASGRSSLMFKSSKLSGSSFFLLKTSRMLM